MFGTVFLIAVILAIPDMHAAIRPRARPRFPIATTIQATLDAADRGRDHGWLLYLS